MKTKRLAIDSMLAAMCAVLGYVAVDAEAFKITFESFPVLVGGLLLGPFDGFLIGTIGTLIYQLIRYGVSLTTVLWILPYPLAGVICGLFRKKDAGQLSQKNVAISVTISEFVITILNTFTIFIDSKIYGWYTPTLITGSLVLRLAVFAAKAVVFSLIIPAILKAGRKQIEQ